MAGVGTCSGTGPCAAGGCVSLSARCSAAALCGRSETRPTAPDLGPRWTGPPRATPSDPWLVRGQMLGLVMIDHNVKGSSSVIKTCKQVKGQANDCTKDLFFLHLSRKNLCNRKTVDVKFIYLFFTNQNQFKLPLILNFKKHSI